jgi:hypothetical protein
MAERKKADGGYVQQDLAVNGVFPCIRWRRKLYIAVRWVLTRSLIAAFAGAECWMTLLALWTLPRATAFHAIT